MQDALKAMLLAFPALLPINYNSDSLVILGINTSHITIGFLLCQCDADNPRICRYMRFGSITLNNHESRFSRPKLEVYSLLCALHALKMYLIGVWNLVVEVDARYIKGMLANPDLVRQMNRWICIHTPFPLHPRPRTGYPAWAGWTFAASTATRRRHYRFSGQPRVR